MSVMETTGVPISGSLPLSDNDTDNGIVTGRPNKGNDNFSSYG